MDYLESSQSGSLDIEIFHEDLYRLIGEYLETLDPETMDEMKRITLEKGLEEMESLIQRCLPSSEAKIPSGLTGVPYKIISELQNYLLRSEMHYRARTVADSLARIHAVDPQRAIELASSTLPTNLRDNLIVNTWYRDFSRK